MVRSNKDKKVQKNLKKRKKMAKKRPSFERSEAWRYKKLKSSWRKARGIDSRIRKKEKGVKTSPNIGHRSPKSVRGLHPTGYNEVLVHNVNELKEVNPRKEVARIGSTVGILKRTMILNKADELNIHVLNPGKALFKEEKLIDLSTMEDIE
ncbi:MAG: 50S ribosomal protein L32e [Promethearchaeota archaeon]|nr:MAG: 50S ribosomal protein L32e [Candidatus Lokiarchaeota archaeon]